MGTIDFLGLGFSVNTGGLASGLGRARGQLNSFGSSLTSAKGLFLGFAGALGVGLSINAFKNAIGEAISSIDALGHSATQIGLSVAALSELQYAAALSGSSAETLSKALQKMEAELGKVRTGSEPAALALNKMGLSVDELKTLAPDEAFKRIADGIKNLPTSADKAAAAMYLFGRSGTELLDVLNSGSDGIEKMQQRARELGISVGDVDAMKIEAANDALGDIGQVFKGIKNQLAIELAPFITHVAQLFTDSATSGGSMGAKVTAAVEMVAKGVAYAADILQAFKLGWELLQAGVTKAIAIVVHGITLMGSSMEAIINLLPGVEVDFTSTLQSIAEELDSLASEQFGNFQEDLIGPSASEKVTKFFDDIKAGAQAAAEGLVPVQSHIEGVGEAMSKATEDAGTLVDKLREQIETFGMSSTEAEIYKLQIAGADEATLQQARSLDEQLKALEESKKAQEELAKAQEEMKNEGTRLFDETRTPLEQYEAKVKDLEKLMSVGAINQDTFNRAVAKAQGELTGGAQSSEMRFAGAATFGSAGARTAILQHQGLGRDPTNDLKKINADQLIAQKSATEYLRQIASKQTAVVIDNF